MTTSYASSLNGSIDDWCATSGRFDVARAASERAAGHQYWFYNGGRPNVGAVIIDAPATDVRVMPWAAYKESVPVYFYWHANNWYANSQMKDGDRHQNIWENPITYDNRSSLSDASGSYANGDGVLVYPGTEVIHTDQDRGIAGPISTIQLANLRRGLQDHQYLTLAKQKGKDAAVESAMSAIVPAIFSEAGSNVSFPETGDAYEKARRALAAAITGP